MDVPDPTTKTEDAGIHAVRIRALDSVFRLEVTGAELAARLRVEWSRCLVDEPDPAETAILVDPGHRGVDAVGYSLATAVTRRAIESAMGRHLMFHAAALTDDRGVALVLVAPSGTGKTTAASTLGASGFGYVTDETVAVTVDGRALPYPKPLSLVCGSGPKRQFGPDELDLGRCPPAPRVGAIVLLDRATGSVEASLEPLGLTEALLALIPHTSAFTRLDRPLHRLCRLIDQCGAVQRLTYAEVADAHDHLARLLGREPGVSSGTSWAALAPDGRPSETDEDQPGRLRRRPWVDAVRIGDEGVVLVDQTPIRLGPLGLTLWLAAEGAPTLRELLGSAVREHGEHPEASALVEDALRRLVDSGVLVGGWQPEEVRA